MPRKRSSTSGGSRWVKIFFLNSKYYEYMEATLIEGLAELGHDVACSREASYGQAIPLSRVPAVAEAADLIVIGSGKGVDYHLLDGVQNPRVVFVDGHDGPSFQVPAGIRFKAVFKREFLDVGPALDNEYIYPLPFAAERRYFVPSQERDIAVSFAATMATNMLRYSIHMRLKERKECAIFSGSTRERAYRSFTDPLQEGNAIETPHYRTLLARSRISVNAPGAGWDCARYWEIAAARAMLFTFLPDIRVPYAFTDGMNCVTFASLREFEEKLDHYIHQPERCAAIAEAGYQHLLRYHTTARRAEQFLALALPASRRQGFCERFHTPAARRPAIASYLRRNTAVRQAKRVAQDISSRFRPL